MRKDVELEVAICVPCGEAEQFYGGALFCEKCGTRHVTGKVWFELVDGAVKPHSLLFTSSSEPEGESHADQGS